MIHQLLAWGCVIGGLAAFLYKAPGLMSGRRRPARIALCVCFMATSLGFMVVVEPFRSLADRFLSMSGAAVMLVPLLMIVVTTAQQVVLVHLSDPPEQATRKAWRRIVGYGVPLIALTAFCVHLGLPKHEVTGDSDILLNMRDPRYAGYLLVHLALYAVGQFETARCCLRYTKIANRPWLIRGMWAVTAGSVIIVCYCVTRGATAFGTWLGATNMWDSHWWIAGSLGPLLQIFGWTVPCWGPKLRGCHRCLIAYCSYQRLRPLWCALYRSTPEIALEPPRSRLVDLIPRRGLEYRLYRRAIEIRDGQLALRRHVARPVSDGPAFPEAGSGASAAQEAATLLAGLRARRPGAPAISDPLSQKTPIAARSDLVGEVQWLTQVSRVFRQLESSNSSNALRRYGEGPLSDRLVQWRSPQSERDGHQVGNERKEGDAHRGATEQRNGKGRQRGTG